jgi:hypothetical protein
MIKMLTRINLTILPILMGRCCSPAGGNDRHQTGPIGGAAGGSCLTARMKETEVREFGPRIAIKTLPWMEKLSRALGCYRYRFDLGWFRLTLGKFIFVIRSADAARFMRGTGDASGTDSRKKRRPHKVTGTV